MDRVALPVRPRRKTSGPIGPGEPRAIWMVRPSESRAPERKHIAALRAAGGEEAVRAEARAEGSREASTRPKSQKRADTGRSAFIAAMAKEKAAPRDPLMYPLEGQLEACRMHDEAYGIFLRSGT